MIDVEAIQGQGTLDVTMTENRLDAIRERQFAYKPMGPLERAFTSPKHIRAIETAYCDIGFLLCEIDRLNAEVERMQIEQAQKASTRSRPERLHMDTEPRRKRTVGTLAFVGIATVRGVLREGGCIAVDLKGTEALITAQNVAVGRLRPGTRAELDESEIPIRQRFGSVTTYSVHPVTQDPWFCLI